MRPYIEFKNVVKQFGNFTALDHVSLEIPKGAFVTLLGPSGCGKTTLMRQLAGFSEPESGDVLVDGKRMNGLPPFKRNTPLVFQEYALFPHMTVYENISYGLKLNKTPKEEMDRRVQEMLKMFNLVGLEKRFPKEMSGGQQQRVAFARALGEYGATSMIAGYTPGKTATIATTVYQLWRTNDEAGAIRWVLVDIVISAVVLLAVNLLEKKQKAGGRA